MKVVPILMAGGIGSRLWPLSRSSYPKQFLSLLSENSMLQDSIQRVTGSFYEKASVICNQEHRFLVAEHFRETGQEPENIILEAEGRGTAFSVAVAALSVQDPDAFVLMLPCDHIIADGRALQKAVEGAVVPAQEGKLVVFGVKPETAHTGYGYIHIEDGGDDVPGLKSFTEKPSQETAEGYIKDGNYLWNAGILFFQARYILDEIEEHAPEVFRAAHESWENARLDLDFIRLAEEPAQDCPSISIDYAVLEKTKNIHAVKLDTKWSDVGSWQSVWNELPKDKDGNAIKGDAVLSDTGNSLVCAADRFTVATLGVQNLAIIADDDAILVADLKQSEKVSDIVAALKEKGSVKQTEHVQVYRPWGSYKVLEQGPNYQIKRLTISPGGAVSLQYHNHRAEHWVVVKGEIKVERDGEEKILKVNESVFIPIKAHHRISNDSKESAELIEVQTGDYLAEDDIVRLEDKYKRETKPFKTGT